MKTSRALIVSLLSMGLIFTSCEKELYIDQPGNLVPKTVDQDPALPSIKVNGAQLHAEAFGNPNDPIVVVLHGGPGGDYRNLLNIRDLANQGYRVVFYDQRGAGLSQRFAYSTYQMREMYDDLSGVIAYYRTSPTQKVFLLGHSWGAILATAYINEYPAVIAGAILAEPGGFKWQDVKDYVTRSIKFKYLSEDLNDAVYQDQFITGNQNDQAILDYKFALRASTSDSEESPMGNEGPTLHWRSGAVTSKAYLDLGNKLNPDWSTNLSQYTTRILFIYSEHNTAYGREHALKVSSSYPNVQLFESLGAGHDMFSFPTGWNNTYPTMLEYLNSLK